jgi:hypothetical protein
MASNTSNVVAADPLMDFRLFKDSLQRGAKGEILPCWDGYSMNPDTRVGSFGAFQLSRIQSWVTKYNLTGIFLDFYGDTTDIDVSRSYEQLPFCKYTSEPPLLVKSTSDLPWLMINWVCFDRMHVVSRSDAGGGGGVRQGNRHLGPCQW